MTDEETDTRSHTTHHKTHSHLAGSEMLSFETQTQDRQLTTNSNLDSDLEWKSSDKLWSDK